MFMGVTAPFRQRQKEPTWEKESLVSTRGRAKQEPLPQHMENEHTQYDKRRKCKARTMKSARKTWGDPENGKEENVGCSRERQSRGKRAVLPRTAWAKMFGSGTKAGAAKAEVGKRANISENCCSKKDAIEKNAGKTHGC